MKPLRHLTYANVVATLALMLAVGGASAFAATQLGKNSVGTKQLKNNAVTGAKVKNGSLSGADIGGAVSRADSAASADRASSAASAQHAADADRLGGQPASSFQPNGSVQRIDLDVSGCATGCLSTLIKANEFVVNAYCTAEFAGEVAVYASGPTGTTFSQLGRINPSGSFVQEEFGLSSTPVSVLGIGTPSQRYQGQMILRSPAHTLTLSLAIFQNGAGACKIAGTALST